ncbi:MAG: hypothetical protein A2528_00870 [Candidatus Staskawiczbacteria bacterium RIFOXYD2_FULL_37_9]|nr:MAG: hypothetical protein A2528_00870 [Candidatus Staskawiczbacteria bacterium RIFOXYD2_FULL_37_9]
MLKACLWIKFAAKINRPDSLYDSFNQIFQGAPPVLYLGVFIFKMQHFHIIPSTQNVNFFELNL